MDGSENIALSKGRNKMKHTNAIGINWKDVRKELFTQDKIHKSNERVVSISKTIEEQKKEQHEKED